MEHDNIKLPTKGLLVISYYDADTQYGFYHLCNIDTKERVAQRYFYDTDMSENLISFLGITDAIKEAPHLGFMEIFSANKVAISWVQKKVCLTKFYSLETMKAIDQSLSILNSNQNTIRIQRWKTGWGKAHDFIYGTIC